MNFLLSFIIPQKMKRFRHMSILIAILIFVASVYLLIFPYKIVMDNQKDELIQEDTMFVLAFYEMPNGSIDFNSLKSNQYKVDGDQLKSIATDDGEFQYIVVSYEKEGKTKNVHMVFDPYSNLDRKILEIRTLYNDSYNITETSTEDETKKASYVSTLTFIALAKDDTLNAEDTMETLNQKTLEELVTDMTNVTLFDYYGITPSVDVDDYLVAFNRYYLGLQIPVFDPEGVQLAANQTQATIIYSENVTFDITTLNSISDLGQNIAQNIINIYVITMQGQYTIQTIIYVLLYPMLIILILWLFFRKNGNLKTFKEYYNIAAISSILPTIVVFAITWFYPSVVAVYGLLLSIFYLFVLFRINSTPEEV